MSLDPEATEQLVDAVSDLLTQAAMICYMHSPTTPEHNHRQLPNGIVCVHDYVNEAGRRVALYINSADPTQLTLSIKLGASEVIRGDAPFSLEDLRPKLDPAEVMRDIDSLPETPEPEVGT